MVQTPSSIVVRRGEATTTIRVLVTQRGPMVQMLQEDVARFNTKELLSWHYADPFFQNLPPDGRVSNEAEPTCGGNPAEERVMHWKDARAVGESEQRLYGLDAWREASYYSDRERAALGWTEALTNVTDGHVPDAAYDAVRGHFSDKELADLTWAVAGINAWNRVAIAFRSEAGTYKPAAHG